MLSVSKQQQNVLIMLNVVMVHVNVHFNLYQMRRKYAVSNIERIPYPIRSTIHLVDPCPKVALNRVKIRYPGNCRRFIDCRRRYSEEVKDIYITSVYFRTKNECPEMTIFNFRTQLCDYRKNVIDCPL